MPWTCLLALSLNVSVTNLAPYPDSEGVWPETEMRAQPLTQRVAAKTLALQLGLTPETLAAMGLNSSQATIVLNRIVDATDLRLELDSANATIEQSGSDLNTLRQQARQSPTEENTLALSNAIQARTQAIAARTHRMNELAELALDGMGIASTHKALCRTDGQTEKLPPHMRLGVTSVAESRRLLRCIAAEEAASNRNEALDSAFSSELSRVRTMSGVSSAAVRIQMNETAIEVAIQSWIQGW